jgi:uncharacterized membrane protein YphA (DoxX/SURF4 family)
VRIGNSDAPETIHDFGGFLMLAAHGAGTLSLDHLWAKRRNA